MISVQGIWFGVISKITASIPTGIMNNASNELLAAVSFASAIAVVITSQKLQSLGRQDETLRSQPLPVSPLAALAAEGKSALNFQKSNGSPDRESLVGTKEKARFFFNFRPPVRTVPPPEILKSTNAALHQTTLLEPNSSQNIISSEDYHNAPTSSSSSSSIIGYVSTEPGDDVARINSSPNVTTRRPPPSPRRHSAFITNDNSETGSDTESNDSDSTVISSASLSGGVKFVDESDSDNSDTDSTLSGQRGRGGSSVGSRSTNFSANIHRWKPQFLLSVTKWEYTDGGDTVYTVQAAYTPSSSWTVRRTYGQFCSWYSSLGGADGELKTVKSPWPPAEFVIFYMPVEAIENRIALLHAFMSEVSRTEDVMRSDRVFRSLLQFLDPDPQDEKVHDDRHGEAIGQNGEDLQM